MPVIATCPSHAAVNRYQNTISGNLVRRSSTPMTSINVNVVSENYTGTVFTFVLYIYIDWKLWASALSWNSSLWDCESYLLNKKLSYRRGTARCVVSVEILLIATQQSRNYLYDKSWTKYQLSLILCRATKSRCRQRLTICAINYSGRASELGGIID